MSPAPVAADARRRGLPDRAPANAAKSERAATPATIRPARPQRACDAYGRRRPRTQGKAAASSLAPRARRLLRFVQTAVEPVLQSCRARLLATGTVLELPPMASAQPPRGVAARVVPVQDYRFMLPPGVFWPSHSSTLNSVRCLRCIACQEPSAGDRVGVRGLGRQLIVRGLGAGTVLGFGSCGPRLSSSRSVPDLNRDWFVRNHLTPPFSLEVLELTRVVDSPIPHHRVLTP
jgi:hypothetical protein